MEETITPEEFKEWMEYLVISNPGDPETFHMLADGLMMDLLIQLGYIDGIKVFMNAKKWYA